MTIIESRPGLEVTIVQNGKALTEHRDNAAADALGAATNYVEVSEEGDFEIVIKCRDKTTLKRDMMIRYRLDDMKFGSDEGLLEWMEDFDMITTDGVSSKTNGVWYDLKIRFSAFAIEQDKTQKIDRSTQEKLKKTGEITILIHHAQSCIFQKEGKSHEEDIPDVKPFGAVPEEAIEALGLSHHCSFYKVNRSEVQNTAGCGWTNHRDEGEDEDAFAVFRFKYRSLTALQALGVVPRSPSPAPVPSSPSTLRAAEHRASLPLQSPRPSMHPTPLLSASEKQLTSDNRNVQVKQEGQWNEQTQSDLSRAEIISMIGIYRGHTNGLEHFPEKELLGLLKYHRNADEPQKSIKRERGDDGIDNVRGEKRRQMEIIALDD